MTTPGYAVTYKPDDKVTRGLQALARNVRALDPALDEIGTMLVTSTHMRFEEQKSPEGVAWAPLAASTIARKKKKRKPLTILQENRYLYDSVAHKVLTHRGVKVGVTRVYGRRQQLGDEGGKPIPARPYLGISPEDFKEIEAILREHMNRGVS